MCSHMRTCTHVTLPRGASDSDPAVCTCLSAPERARPRARQPACFMQSHAACCHKCSSDPLTPTRMPATRSARLHAEAGAAPAQAASLTRSRAVCGELTPLPRCRSSERPPRHLVAILPALRCSRQSKIFPDAQCTHDRALWFSAEGENGLRAASVCVRRACRARTLAIYSEKSAFALNHIFFV